MFWSKYEPVYDGGFFENNGFQVIPRSYMYTDKINVHLFAYMDDWSQIANGNKQLISCTEGGGWGIGYNANTVGHGTEIYIDGQGYKGVNFGIENLSPGYHEFHMIFTGTQFRGYLDNSLAGTVDVSGTIKYNATNAIFIGAEAGSSATTPGGNYFNGSISSVIIANADLSEPLAVLTNRVVKVPSDHTLYANWRVKHYDVNVNCSPVTSSNISVTSPLPGCTKYPYGRQIQISTTDRNGANFIKWSDNSVSKSRTETVTGNISLTALYELARLFSQENLIPSNYISEHSIPEIYCGDFKLV